MKGFQDLHTEAPADHSGFDPFLLGGSLVVLNATGGGTDRKETVSFPKEREREKKKKGAGPEGQISCFLISLFALSLKAFLLPFTAKQAGDLTIAGECLACKMTPSLLPVLSPHNYDLLFCPRTNHIPDLCGA